MEVYQFNTQLGTIWLKLTHEGISELDRHYRSSASRSSPFTINLYHRCMNGYYEFTLKQFLDIWQNKIKYNRESLYYDRNILFCPDPSKFDIDTENPYTTRKIQE